MASNKQLDSESVNYLIRISKTVKQIKVLVQFNNPSRKDPHMIPIIYEMLSRNCNTLYFVKHVDCCDSAINQEHAEKLIQVKQLDYRVFWHYQYITFSFSIISIRNYRSNH